MTRPTASSAIIPADSEAFFEIVHKHTPANAVIGLTTIVGSFVNTRWYQRRYIARLVEDALAIEKRANVYVRVGALAQRPEKGRGLERETIGASVLYVDFDTYSNKEAGLSQLQSMPKPPSLIVDSGNGYHAYWSLDRFCPDYLELKKRNKQLALDLGADSCFDLARVLRLPGTWNIKRDTPLPCTIVVNAPGRVYALEDFAPAELDAADRVDLSDAEPLPADFPTRVEGPLWARIASEASARQAGAPRNGNGRVDRSANDHYIAMRLLELRFTPGQVLTVLTDAEWFSSDKTRERGFQYAERTVQKAVAEYQRKNPMHGLNHIDLMNDDYPRSDLGNAKRMYTLFGENMHFVEAWGKWLVWDGKRWRKDYTSQIDRLAHRTAEKMCIDAASIADEDRRKKAMTFAVSTQNANRLQAMVNVASSLDGVKVAADAFDADQWLLNVSNGTLDLRTGTLRPHNRRDLMTKIVWYVRNTWGRGQDVAQEASRLSSCARRVIRSAREGNWLRPEIRSSM